MRVDLFTLFLFDLLGHDVADVFKTVGASVTLRSLGQHSGTFRRELGTVEVLGADAGFAAEEGVVDDGLEIVKRTHVASEVDAAEDPNDVAAVVEVEEESDGEVVGCHVGGAVTG